MSTHITFSGLYEKSFHNYKKLFIGSIIAKSVLTVCNIPNILHPSRYCESFRP